MKESVLKFLDDEITSASGDRLKQLRAVKGYLVAAKNLRASLEQRSLYDGERVMRDTFTDRYDLECSMVDP